MAQTIRSSSTPGLILDFAIANLVPRIPHAQPNHVPDISLTITYATTIIDQEGETSATSQPTGETRMIITSAQPEAPSAVTAASDSAPTFLAPTTLTDMSTSMASTFPRPLGTMETVGISIGSTFAVGLFLALGVWCWFQKRRRKQEMDRTLGSSVGVLITQQDVPELAPQRAGHALQRVQNRNSEDFQDLNNPTSSHNLVPVYFVPSPPPNPLGDFVFPEQTDPVRSGLDGRPSPAYSDNYDHSTEIETISTTNTGELLFLDRRHQPRGRASQEVRGRNETRSEIPNPYADSERSEYETQSLVFEDIMQQLHDAGANFDTLRNDNGEGTTDVNQVGPAIEEDGGPSKADGKGRGNKWQVAQALLEGRNLPAEI